MNSLPRCPHCGRVRINGHWMKFKTPENPDALRFSSVECSDCGRVSEYIAVVKKKEVA